MTLKKLILICFVLLIGFVPEIEAGDGLSKEYKSYVKSKSVKMKMKKRTTYQFRFRTMKPGNAKKKRILFPFASNQIKVSNNFYSVT
jgi:hypothetical protein